MVTINIMGFTQAFEALSSCVKHHVNVGKSAPGSDEFLDLESALQNSQQPMLATYLCDVSATALTGLPDISGENKSTRMTLSVDASGQLHVNGTTIVPQYADPPPSDGAPIAVVA